MAGTGRSIDLFHKGSISALVESRRAAGIDREKDKEAVFQRRPELMYISSKTAKRMRPRGIKSFSSRRDGCNLQCFQWFYDCPLPSGAIAFFINNASPFLVLVYAFIESLCSRHRVYQSCLITLLGFASISSPQHCFPPWLINGID